jgi:hypothetical protein
MAAMAAALVPAVLAGRSRVTVAQVERLVTVALVVLVVMEVAALMVLTQPFLAQMVKAEVLVAPVVPVVRVVLLVLVRPMVTAEMVALRVRLVTAETARMVMREHPMVVRAALVVIRVLQVAAVSQGLERELQARMVQPVQRSRLAVTVAMEATGITRALISARLLERRAVTAVLLVMVELWVTAATVATAVTVLTDPRRV